MHFLNDFINQVLNLGCREYFPCVLILNTRDYCILYNILLLYIIQKLFINILLLCAIYTF